MDSAFHFKEFTLKKSSELQSTIYVSRCTALFIIEGTMEINLTIRDRSDCYVRKGIAVSGQPSRHEYSRLRHLTGGGNKFRKVEYVGHSHMASE